MPKKAKRSASLLVRRKSNKYRTKKVREEEEEERGGGNNSNILELSFEGKCGKDVESKEAVSWHDNDEERQQKYDDSAAFRIVVGPSIVLYEESGYDESLFGLQIDLDFGVFGSLRGIVQKKHNPFEISWRCGPNFDTNKRGVETFTSTTTMEGSEILAWYYLQRKDDRPPWVNEKDKDVGKDTQDFIHSLTLAPEGTILVNWQRLPMEEASMFFADLKKNDMVERMDITLSKLNDPEGAMFYGPDKIYPVPFLLAIYAYSIGIDPSTPLPILTTPENKELFTYVDRFYRFLINRDDDYGGRTGYKQLTGLEAIVEEYSNETIKSEQGWKKSYLFAQALMLLLSDKYEEPIRTYQMVDDPHRLFQLCSNILNVFNNAMLPSRAPTDSTQDQLRKDLHFNNQHLQFGSFITIVSDEDFQSDKRNKHRYMTFQGCIVQDSDLSTTT